MTNKANTRSAFEEMTQMPATMTTDATPSVPPRTKLLQAIRKRPWSTIRELQIATGMSSPSVVDYHLNKMMIAGIIRKVNRYEVLDDEA